MEVNGHSSSISIVIADDHALVRDGIRRILEASPGFAVAGQAPDGREALRLCLELKPDVVLLDLSMPHCGLRLVSELTALPGLRVLVLTMHRDPLYCRDVLQLGASGYTIKAGTPEELVLAIHAVARGEVYIHPSLTRAVLGETILGPGARESDPWRQLSSRQQQVIRRIALGFTNREVAEELGIGVKTVETYRARGMAALEVATKAQLISYLLRRGLLEDPD